MRSRVLVTGAYGFVGRHVARAVARQGAEVIAIGHGSWSREEWRDWGIAQWHPTDVTIEALATYGGAPEAVFHCAGSGSVAFSLSHPYQDYQRTVATTHSVLEYIRTSHSDAKLVLPSSAGVYGVATVLPTSVEAPLHPVSPYGLHKKLAEDLCRSYGRHFGVRSAIVRLFSIYGTGLRKQLLWDACAKLTQGEARFGGTGEETRDWLHIEDAAALMIAAADHGSASCPVVNGGTGEATSIKAILHTIADEFGAQLDLDFSGQARPGDPAHYQAEIAEALAWGWKPTRRWSDETRAYVRWFKEGAH
ncbi:NAD-dependent epimerase/dehydratase family protein [Mesorhizobium sp. M0814]|uniref:NAD-dependent epimerase/dehydratase family protein n=1 Tax=unclassified Mesorhizobium TaxID=325217 RepID=UPI0033388A46